MGRHPAFRIIWFVANVLLIASFFFLLYSLGWEYSTRKYLKGFSDAIVPVSATPEEKVQAILSWMAHGPSRQSTAMPSELASRDPEDTLNYVELLRVCGSATNAFVNLANSSGLPARRLLLLDENDRAIHVVAEAYVDGRWIIADPSFRAILRGADGQPLTKEQLSVPKTFAEATRDLPGYKPDYNFARTTNIRLARLPVVGNTLQGLSDRYFPTWDDPVYWTLLVERKSLAAAVVAACFLLLSFILRLGLRWYAETRLGVIPVHMREQLRRAGSAFLGGSA